MKQSMLGIFIILLSGCTGQLVILENEKGERVRCEVSTASAMLTGAAMRNAKMNKCTREYKEQGYTKVIKAE